MKWIVSLILLSYVLICGCSSASTATDENPEWLNQLIRKLESAPVANPPASITRYEYKGQLVYYIPPRSGDIPSTLLDASGNVLCMPDGGITGEGDGRCPDFFDERKNGQVIWQDPRS